MLLFNLSKQNIALSKAEVLSIMSCSKSTTLDNPDYLFDNYLSLDSAFDEQKVKELAKRLAYTKAVYQLLFISDPDTLTADIKKFDWPNVYKKDFCVRLKNTTQPTEKSIAAIIWNSLVKAKIKPKVNLTKSKTELHFIFTNKRITAAKIGDSSEREIHFMFTAKKVIVGKLIYHNAERFKKRAAHLRPELSPTSLDPRLARALVNLSCANVYGACKASEHIAHCKTVRAFHSSKYPLKSANEPCTFAESGETILDPFCGVGGILIEAGMMGMKVVGCDIDKIALKKCKINLDHFKLKDYKLINQDALKIKKHYDYIITDLPYGKNSKINKELKALYSGFLKNCKQHIKPKIIVVGVPDFINFEKMIDQSHYRLKQHFSHYIHKSLTKEIYVLG